MAYIIDGDRAPPMEYGDYGYGGFFSKVGKALGKATKAVGSAVAAVAKPVTAVGRAIDPTYSKGLVGQVTYRVARPAVATAAAVVTGGASVLAAEKGLISKSTFGVKPTAQGVMIGAAAGTAIFAGGSALKALQTGAAKAVQVTAETAPPATSVPVIDAQDPGATSPKAGGGLLGPAAGAGVGFLAGGPVGAAVGAGVGFFLGRK